MTFSVTKSYLSTLAGLAVEKGLIKDIHDPVIDYVDDGGYDSPHNAKITWHHSLQQTSEWVGVIWDKHYQAGSDDTTVRDLEEPGTYFEYNDARVNRLALSLLHVWRNPLPQVLKDLVMDPIDASPKWRWYGYRNSWITLDGLKMQSVSGGGHWGGGMQISTRDHARFGLLFLRHGKWKDNQIVPQNWIDLAVTPGDVNPSYGYMWWMDPNHRDNDGKVCQFSARGAGGNRILVDTENDLVIVVRWLAADRFNEFFKMVIESIKK
jgi:CubicO group peptidase (beta-lactamase class C family)